MKSRVTPWFARNIKPRYPGVYERRFAYSTSSMFNYWDGFKWYFGARTPFDALKNYQRNEPSTAFNLQWRGLAENPNER